MDSKDTSSATVSSSIDDRYVYSNLFERLVETPNELTGLLAYALYQQKKRCWIKQFQLDRHRMPSELEVKDYCYTYGDQELVDLRQQADQIVADVSEAVVAQRIEALKENALNARMVEEIAGLRRLFDRLSGYRHHVIGFAVLVGIYFFVTFAVAHEPTVSDFFSRHF